jgi:hypothetical protein
LTYLKLNLKNRYINDILIIYLRFHPLCTTLAFVRAGFSCSMNWHNILQIGNIYHTPVYIRCKWLDPSLHIIQKVFTTKNFMMICIHRWNRVNVMVFNAILQKIFQLYRGSQFYWWGNQSTRRKSPTYRKSLTNCITYYCIEYTSPWVRFELTTLLVIGTNCICSYKHNYHTITIMSKCSIQQPLKRALRHWMWISHILTLFDMVFSEVV